MHPNSRGSYSYRRVWIEPMSVALELGVSRLSLGIGIVLLAQIKNFLEMR